MWYSAVDDPEDLSAADAGYQDIVNAGGAMTGILPWGDLFFSFQEQMYITWQHQIGDNPFYRMKEWHHGCNFFRTIVVIGGWVYYLSNVGEIRRTNGYDDQCLSERIRPLTNAILNNRNIKDYYDATAPNAAPNAVYDEYNNAYRLFYAGSSSNTDKCLSYFIDRDLFTTATDTDILSAFPIFGYANKIVVCGNSDADGTTNYLLPAYASTGKTGTLDLGWIGHGSSSTRLNFVEVWVHAEAGETSADDCDCTLSLAIYDDPEDPDDVAQTITGDLDYNDDADNLQKITFAVGTQGDMIRPVLSDSGSKRNYSIEKIVIDYDPIN